MPVEIPALLLEGIPKILHWSTGGTLVSFLALYITWRTTLPQLAIDGTSDKSKKYNSESRLKLKNIGKLDAVNIICAVENMKLTFGSTSITANLKGNIHRISCLSAGEVAEITTMVGFDFNSAIQITKCTYLLRATYEARFLFFKRTLKKNWTIDLRNFEDGFNWTATPVAWTPQR